MLNSIATRFLEIPVASIIRRLKCVAYFSVICVFLNVGCISSEPYRFGKFHPAGASRPELVIEYGEPSENIDRIHQTFDQVQYVLETPARLLHLSPKRRERELSSENIEKIQRYLEENDLEDVHVAVNQYDLAGHWQRIKENERIAPGWRYTFGVLDLCGYTLMPGRIFGRNTYSPYANTLSLNSDEPLTALTAAAYAKEIHGQSLPGTYYFVSRLPLISVWPQMRATRDVIGYAKLVEDWDVEKEAYVQLYSQALAQSTVVIVPFLPTVWGLAAGLGVGATGHLIGVATANQRDKERLAELSESAEIDEFQQTAFTDKDQDDN